MKNKKADTVLVENVIFFVLNIVFIALLLVFVWRAGQGALIYEQTYAKQIALLIDNAKPEMELLIDMEKVFKIAEDRDPNDVIKIDKNENRVIVSLGGSGGYSFQYFSDYNIEKSFDGKYLNLKISKK